MEKRQYIAPRSLSIELCEEEDVLVTLSSETGSQTIVLDDDDYDVSDVVFEVKERHNVWDEEW